MDPITAAVLAALGAGVAKSAGEVGGKAIIDAYNRLKGALKNKFGDESQVAKAVEELEADPDSAARKEVLKEKVAVFKADQEPDVHRAAQDLLDRLRAQPDGEQHIQQAIGDYIAQADRGGTARVNVNRSGE